MIDKSAKQIVQGSLYFRQPQGLGVIATLAFFVSLCINPFISMLGYYTNIDFFYDRNDYIFVFFFAASFGCISNFIFGANRSIVHGLQLIIIAELLSFINNMDIFALAMAWVGIACVLSNLMFSLSAFYLKNDSRRLYGFLGIFSSVILGVSTGGFIHHLLLIKLDDFKIFYASIICVMLIFFLRYSYKLNTSLSNKTERLAISFHGAFVIFFIFSCILFYFLLHIEIFSILNVFIFPISLFLLTFITFENNKEDGKKLLKYIFFCLAILIINKVIYLTFMQHQDVIKDDHLSSPFNLSILFGLQYVFCIVIYISWKLNLIKIKIESIINASIIKYIFYIEAFRIFLLIISSLSVDPTVSNNLFIFTLIISLFINILIIPIYFSLGKILAGSKNEIIITTLLYLIFSSLIFISFIYKIDIVSTVNTLFAA